MRRTIFLFLLASVLAGCVAPSVAPDPSILRVGVTPDSPPIIFKRDGQISGIEADFAWKLGEALNREVVFIEVPWHKQDAYLRNNRIDILMSGIIIVPARSTSMDFTTPYLNSGLTGLFRRNNYDPSGLIKSAIKNQTKEIGFVAGSSGEHFVLQNFPSAEHVSFSDVQSAVESLKKGHIDLFIHDAPVVWWFSSLNRAQLISFPQLFNTEPLAWGVGRQNRVLREQINGLIAQWEKDGTSEKIVNNWIPSLGN